MYRLVQIETPLHAAIGNLAHADVEEQAPNHVARRLVLHGAEEQEREVERRVGQLQGAQLPDILLPAVPRFLPTAILPQGLRTMVQWKEKYETPRMHSTYSLTKGPFSLINIFQERVHAEGAIPRHESREEGYPIVVDGS